MSMIVWGARKLENKTWTYLQLCIGTISQLGSLLKQILLRKWQGVNSDYNVKNYPLKINNFTCLIGRGGGGKQLYLIFICCKKLNKKRLRRELRSLF